MTKINFAVLHAAVLGLSLSTMAPASAVQIRKVNRAEGDPAAVTPVRSGPQLPADTTGPRLFDKKHDGGAPSQ